MILERRRRSSVEESFAVEGEQGQADGRAGEAHAGARWYVEPPVAVRAGQENADAVSSLEHPVLAVELEAHLLRSGSSG